MPVNVEIKAEGLALCFAKILPGDTEETWNIAFLCDEHHKLKLKINNASQPINWWPRHHDLTLRIQHSGGTPTLSGRDKVHDLLNLANDDYAHGTDPTNTRVSNLEIKRDKKLTDLVWLQVPRAVLDVDGGKGKEDTKILKIAPDPGVPSRIADRAKGVKLTFTAEGDVRAILRDYPHDPTVPPPTTTLPDPLPVKSGKITLEFDNRCLGSPGCKRNDFIDVYEFVEDKDRAGKLVKFVSWAEDAETRHFIFAAAPDEAKKQNDLVDKMLANGEWVKIESKRPGEVLLQKKSFKEKLDSGKSGPYGNCDPAGSEPPPGP